MKLKLSNLRVSFNEVKNRFERVRTKIRLNGKQIQKMFCEIWFENLCKSCYGILNYKYFNIINLSFNRSRSLLLLTRYEDKQIINFRAVISMVKENQRYMKENVLRGEGYEINSEKTHSNKTNGLRIKSSISSAFRELDANMYQ